jgi:hypothetical protein
VNRTLILMVLVVIVLAWNFVFTDKKVGLTDQARVLQGLSTVLPYKAAIADYWKQNGVLPGQAEWQTSGPAINPELSQTIVTSIDVGVDGPGVITVHYTARPGLEAPERIAGKTIKLIPAINNASIVWTCKGTLETALLPRNCTAL